MGSNFHGNCEIVEVKDEVIFNHGPHTFRRFRPQDGDQKQPIVKKGSNNSLEDDINKLFEAVNPRTCKSLDLSDSWRNSSKRPMKAAGSHSPGIGFSEPVSLKQALRGLCISQAAEMAALKRLSMPSASPRISEVGKMSNFSQCVVIGSNGIRCSQEQRGECRTDMPLVPEDGTPTSSEISPPRFLMKMTMKSNSSDSAGPGVKPGLKSVHNIVTKVVSLQGEYVGDTAGTSLARPHNLPVPKTKSPNKSAKSPLSQNVSPLKSQSPSRSANTSPRLHSTLGIQSVERPSSVYNSLPDSRDHKQSLETACRKGEKTGSVSIKPQRKSCENAYKPDKKIPGSNKVAISPLKGSVTSLRVVNKEPPKTKRKARLHNIPSLSRVKSNKDAKSSRSASRAVKTVTRNKFLVLKKSRNAAVSDDGNSKASYKLNGLGQCSGKLICERCQCSVKAEINDLKFGPLQETLDANVSTESRNCDMEKAESIPRIWENRAVPISKTNMSIKPCEKGDISQSSKSSICDFSSSTSLSEDSNLSGFSCGNRPHMSKDVRWEAINRVRKRHGFIGLSHFNLLEKLGSGDIGTVYLAELVGTDCLFAIKVMDNEFLARRKKTPRAQTEREILRMLDHPFLPTLYAQFTSDNLSCLLMECCPGGDLHVLRQKQPGRYFPEQAARFYVAEVLLALEYLHMLGLIYRDLKPENILVREDGHIMLTDFDLSLRCSVSPTLVKSSLIMEPPRISGPCAGSNCMDPFCTGPSCKVSCFSRGILPATARARKLKANAAAKLKLLPQLVAEPTEARSNSFVGTHEYLAPEIIKGEGHGSPVDWWTLGVFLYELLYGKAPFKGAGNEETLTNVVLQNLNFPDSPIVSFQARDLIRCLLVKEPENRLGTETGAAEIKRHPFFDGLNWALIRCVIPPQIPEPTHNLKNSQILAQEKGKGFLEYSSTGEQLEFELF